MYILRTAFCVALFLAFNVGASANVLAGNLDNTVILAQSSSSTSRFERRYDEATESAETNVSETAESGAGESGTSDNDDMVRYQKVEEEDEADRLGLTPAQERQRQYMLQKIEKAPMGQKQRFRDKYEKKYGKLPSSGSMDDETSVEELWRNN